MDYNRGCRWIFEGDTEAQHLDPKPKDAEGTLRKDIHGSIKM